MLNSVLSVITSALFQDHMGVCRYNLVRCPNRGCEAQPMFQCDLHRHVNEECLYQPVPCRLCRMNVAQALMHDHFSQDCMDYEIQCPNGCGNSVKRRDVSLENRPVICHVTILCKIPECGHPGTCMCEYIKIIFIFMLCPLLLAV